MNPVKNLMEDALNTVGKNAFFSSSNKTELSSGLCITCDNNSHCIWIHNDKIYCQHFE